MVPCHWLRPSASCQKRAKQPPQNCPATAIRAKLVEHVSWDAITDLTARATDLPRALTCQHRRPAGQEDPFPVPVDDLRFTCTLVKSSDNPSAKPVVFALSTCKPWARPRIPRIYSFSELAAPGLELYPSLLLPKTTSARRMATSALNSSIAPRPVYTRCSELRTCRSAGRGLRRP